MLYFSEPYLRQLTTEVVMRKQDQRGSWYAFEQTIFYPQGGGQSADRGWINEQAVLDVQKDGEMIWHLVGENLSDKVEMKLDWEYRYDNMRQHTGQHVLSASFQHLFNFATVSVHLGSVDTLIELSTGAISAGQLQAAEDQANRIIARNLPVKQLWIYRTDLQQYNLRRDIKVEDDPIRIIQIGDHDCTGCGGTHVQSTAEIGLIKIISTEMIRKHVRVQSKIGRPAYEYFDQLNSTIQQLCSQLSMEIKDLPGRVQMLLDEQRELKRQLKTTSEKWLSEYANGLLPEDSFGLFIVSDINSEQANKLSSFWAEKNNLPCFIISSTDRRSNFTMRTPAGHNRTALDFIKQHGKSLDLKGGGSPEFVQGMIGKVTDDTYRSMLQQNLREYFQK